ncbi:hypothetical protein JTB14_007302 [Gonioctena quinquepunctata]|nr:hypothetical protein JTB14_007302 [Gonioctena quinquepunctata]
MDEVIEFVIAQNTIHFEEEISEEGTSVANAMNAAIVWGPVNGDNLHKFTFEDKDSAGFSGFLYENFYNKSPLEFYEYFVDDDISFMMVEETNRYALQNREKSEKKSARIATWRNTDVAEMERFLGIVIWMGLCRFPSLQSYWSKNTLYPNHIKKIMPRNRFQI